MGGAVSASWVAPLGQCRDDIASRLTLVAAVDTGGLGSSCCRDRRCCAERGAPEYVSRQFLATRALCTLEVGASICSSCIRLGSVSAHLRLHCRAFPCPGGLVNAAVAIERNLCLRFSPLLSERMPSVAPSKRLLQYRRSDLLVVLGKKRLPSLRLEWSAHSFPTLFTDVVALGTGASCCRSECSVCLILNPDSPACSRYAFGSIWRHLDDFTGTQRQARDEAPAIWK